MRPIFTLCLFVFSAAASQAQAITVQLSSNRTIREEISNDQAETIRLKMTDLLAEYQQKGNLLDPETGSTTELAANQFKDLFRIDAQHFVDYRDKPSLLNLGISDYKDDLFNAFGYEVFKYRVENAIIQEITPQKDGNLLVNLVFTKEVTNQQYGRGAIKDISEQGGRKFYLQMDVVFDSDLESGQIIDVKCIGNCTTVAANDESYIAGAGGYVIPLITGDPVADTDISFSETQGHKLELNYLTNTLLSSADAERKPLFASFGLGYQFWKETANGGPGNAKEIVTLHMLRASVGASYRLFGEAETAVHLELQAIPGISLATTKRLNARAGDPELMTRTALWLQASPTLYREIVRNEPAIGLQLSLDFGFNAISPFQGSAEGTDPFGAKDRTIVNDEVLIHYLGVRLGVNLHSSRAAN